MASSAMFLRCQQSLPAKQVGRRSLMSIGESRSLFVLSVDLGRTAPSRMLFLPIPMLLFTKSDVFN
jgi:hypothetical protein